MEPIVWNDAFSVGVGEMDSQHRKLISMINRLVREQKNLTDPKTIAELLTEMTDYAGEHFRAEEYLMSEYGYDLIDKQVEQHQQFIETIQGFYSATDIGANILSKALLQYLTKWLTRHILEEDMKYKPFFQTKGIS